MGASYQPCHAERYRGTMSDDAFYSPNDRPVPRARARVSRSGRCPRTATPGRRNCAPTGPALSSKRRSCATGISSSADDGELALPDQPEAAQAKDNADDQYDQSNRRFLPSGIGHIWIHFGQPLAYWAYAASFLNVSVVTNSLRRRSDSTVGVKEGDSGPSQQLATPYHESEER